MNKILTAMLIMFFMTGCRATVIDQHWDDNRYPGYHPGHHGNHHGRHHGNHHRHGNTVVIWTASHHTLIRRF